MWFRVSEKDKRDKRGSHQSELSGFYYKAHLFLALPLFFTPPLLLSLSLFLFLSLVQCHILFGSIMGLCSLSLSSVSVTSELVSYFFLSLWFWLWIPFSLNETVGFPFVHPPACMLIGFLLCIFTHIYLFVYH